MRPTWGGRRAAAPGASAPGPPFQAALESHLQGACVSVQLATLQQAPQGEPWLSPQTLKSGPWGKGSVTREQGHPRFLFWSFRERLPQRRSLNSLIPENLEEALKPGLFCPSRPSRGAGPWGSVDSLALLGVSQSQGKHINTLRVSSPADVS